MLLGACVHVIAYGFTLCGGELVEQVSCGWFPNAEVFMTTNSQLPAGIIINTQWRVASAWVRGYGESCYRDENNDAMFLPSIMGEGSVNSDRRTSTAWRLEWFGE